MDGEEFFNCPIKFIPENVWSWYQQYTYAEQFNKIREYGDMPARWIEAYHYFRGQSNHFVEVVAESRKKRQDRTGDGLAMLTQTKKRLTNGRDD